jgi:hypothetical protein
MRTKVVHTPYYPGGARGEDLVHWIYNSDLLLPATPLAQFKEPAGGIVGAHYGYKLTPNWIIFYRLQVIQIVPEEVHSYWHLNYRQQESDSSCVWEIEDSQWLASFDPRHLQDKDYKHYIIVFNDELVEVICRDLIFGEGLFDINVVVANDARFNYAYFRYADAQEELGNLQAAVEYYQKYIESDPQGESVEYARGCMEICLEEMRTGTMPD